MSNEISTWVDAIEKTRERFLQIAPTEMKFETEKGFAVQILKNNDYLMTVAQNHPNSLMQAVTNVAAIGLSLNPAEKQAYLISRTVKTEIDRKTVYQSRIFLEPSYMGLIKLATDSGSIKWVQAYPVYSNDEFVFNGAGEKPSHKFNAFAKDRGEFVGVYCVAKTADGDYLTAIMDSDQVNSVRDRSESWKAHVKDKSKNAGPWGSDFTEQAKKSVIRQAFKTWPRTSLNRMATAVEISNDNEGFGPILTSPNLGDYTAEMKSYFDELIQKGDALRMFVFQVKTNDQNESIFTNLYHSFEKGQKGKYQKVIDDLIARGYNIVSDIRVALNDAINIDDDQGVKENIIDFDKDTIDVILSGINPSIAAEIKKIAGLE
jgi:recombination protein RecT